MTQLDRVSLLRRASIRTVLLWCAFIGENPHVGKDRRGKGREGAGERPRGRQEVLARE